MNTIAQPQPVALSSGQVEVLKWVALVAMVVDHVNAVFFARELGEWATVLGRVALPLFAIVLGVNLARPGVDVCKVTRRLVTFGTLAVPAYAHLFGMVGLWPLNVMFTFAVAVGVVWATERDEPIVAGVLFLCGAALVEYWWPGVALVVGVWGWARNRHPQGVWPVVLALAGLCLLNGNAWALWAIPVLIAVRSMRLDNVPRLRWVFYAFYPVHLAVIALVRGVGA